MTSAVELAHKYAQAFMHKEGKNITHKEYDALIAARDAMEQNKFLLQLFDVPTMTENERNVCIEKLLKYYSLPSSLTSLVKLLCKHARILLFGHVLDAVVQLYQEEHNSIEITVYTSSEIGDDEREIIIKFVTSQVKKNVIASFVVMPSLIAGVRIESDQFVWDYSVQKQLRSISSL